MRTMEAAIAQTAGDEDLWTIPVHEQVAVARPETAAGPFAIEKRGSMEARKLCAYNQTRECFLGLEVVGADLAHAALAERIKALGLRSGEGLWIAPFRSLPEPELPAPLDVLYLDEEGRVLDAVESYATSRRKPAGAKAASVLVLPAHSIYSSQTQTGDQLVVCAAEEMENRLEKLASGRSVMQVESAALLREEPLWSGGPGMLELELRPEQRQGAAQHHVMGLAKPEARTPRAPRKWLERWWSPDPRRAPREAAPGLAAYYWNGAAPEPHGIRDISSSGLYVITEERWYPGTLVLMILQRTDGGEELAERSIAVLSRAVRWGHDGVGLQFVLADDRNGKQAGNGPAMGADRKEFERFLQQLKRGR
ncbi:MAG TPA: PilZ domain-containing protein [Terracidiphilus sp.]|jgi:hypothetical protein|nr:PilZ domain-containing protein [Terracidiphilus sp.]